MADNASSNVGCCGCAKKLKCRCPPPKHPSTLSHESRVTMRGGHLGPDTVPAPHFSLRRSRRGQMLRPRPGAGGLGFPEAKAEGVETDRPGAAGLSHEGRLPASLYPRAYCCRLSGRRLVPLLHPGCPGTHYPGTFNWGQRSAGICLCRE